MSVKNCLSGVSIFICFLLFIGNYVYSAENRPLICKTCNMKIDEVNRKFSVIDMKSMETSVFDDIGCALIWRNEQCATMQSSFDSNAIVYDYYTGEAIQIESAFYVVDSGINTPMGYGILAFKNMENATRFVSDHKRGKILSYDTLLSIKLR